MRARPTATQSVVSIAQQVRRSSEEEESALHTVSEAQPSATSPPLTEGPEVERAKGYVSRVSLGAMVMAEAATSTSARKAVSAGGLPKEGSALPRANTEPPSTLVWTGHSSGWGGPRVEWIDLLTLGAVPFILDDVTEEKEWGSFTGYLKGMAHSLNILLAKLNNTPTPARYEVRMPSIFV
jgi:hypothetical protein